jgi:hypothetical protein
MSSNEAPSDEEWERGYWEGVRRDFEARWMREVEEEEQP